MPGALKGELEEAKGNLKFYKDFAARKTTKLNFCISLLKLSDNPLLKNLAEKIDNAYAI